MHARAVKTHLVELYHYYATADGVGDVIGTATDTDTDTGEGVFLSRKKNKNKNTARAGAGSGSIDRDKDRDRTVSRYIDTEVEGPEIDLFFVNLIDKGGMQGRLGRWLLAAFQRVQMGGVQVLTRTSSGSTPNNGGGGEKNKC